MKKSDLAKAAAQLRGVEPSAAADQIDGAVNKLMRALRSGRSAHLPGLGTISPGKRRVFRPERHDR